MKPKHCSWLFAAILIASCSGNSSKKENVSEETSKASTEKTAASGHDATAPSDETEKRIEELKKLTPITNDQLKSFFPSEVMGIKRSQFSVNSMTGYATGTAEYKKDDTTTYRVLIYDCAGEAGSAFYGMRFLTGWNIEREDDNGYEKTVSFMGTKALEQYGKHDNRYSLHLESISFHVHG